MAYSGLKLLLPHFLRTFIRDLDSAYQERLKEIDLKNQQIKELQDILQESQNHLVKKIDLKNQQIKELQDTLQESQNHLVKEIDLKNQQIKELQDTLQESQNHLVKKIDLKNQEFLELESTYQKILKGLESQNRRRRIQESNMSDEDYEKLSKAGLFIIGSARSGTSILCDCLNLSPDVFLLGEANLYIHHNLDNFVEFFNNQHIQFNNRRSKGTFAPPSRLSESGGINFLSRMKKNYNFVGEKIAFGPNGKIDNQSFQEVFFNFNAIYFYFSNYILIIRRPAEVVLSMLKIFPETSLDLIFDCWLRTLQIQIDVFQSFPYSYVIFFENLSNETVMNLCSLIGINIHIPKGIFREENKYSLLAEDEIPDELELSKYQKICLFCEEVYKKVKNEFDLETFKFKETTANYGAARYGFSYNIQKQIDDIIHELASFQA
ncbi:hypothetical protein [Nostoc sp. ChiQUE01b]|uniref:coiled-coil domain-containing protein n=1 Tax=Nostoc sp. ChiQUE01b TaxID=3075376 RepID=UPI002AD45BDD|nr:hypothetical protein [Nostoc sp. ChiQUE01b]MDZ8260898.1 hypothetical protein [Nostoc sp. ChiQUE01b]